jgi:hypothetical protein
MDLVVGPLQHLVGVAESLETVLPLEVDALTIDILAVGLISECSDTRTKL